MNKEQQIKEMTQDFINFGITTRQGVEAFAEILYNAGYRKTFTSDFESDTQKAYKEGYIKGIEEREAEIEILKIQNKNRGYQPPQYSNGYKPTITPKPAPPKCPTPSPKSISIDTFKEMNAMCNIADHRKQAVKEFAEKLKDSVADYLYKMIDEGKDNVVGMFELREIVDNTIKEYEQ